MAPRWDPSSEKHGVARRDQIFAIVHATFVRQIEGPAGDGKIMLYIGPEHAQTDREIEVLVREYPQSGREAVVFHAMPLGPKFRRFREENPDGWTR